MQKIFLLILAFNTMSACVQKQQYEIMSPCVSEEVTNPWMKNPCTHKLLNHEIV